MSEVSKKRKSKSTKSESSKKQKLVKDKTAEDSNGKKISKPTNKKALLEQIDKGGMTGKNAKVTKAKEATGDADAGENKQVFVKGLAKSTNEDMLRQYFSSFGKVSEVEIVKDKKGKSRGYGFVNFDKPGSVKKTLAKGRHALQEQSFSVDVAKPKPIPSADDILAQVKPLSEAQKEKLLKQKEKRKADFYAKRKAKKADKFKGKQNAIFVAGLAPTTTEQQLQEYFGTYGTVSKVHIVKNEDVSRGYGFVVFDTVDSDNLTAADKAVAAGSAKPHTINSKQIVCKLADKREASETSKDSKETKGAKGKA